MVITYFDETGDDGYRETSSDIFVLTSIYLHHSNWQKIYVTITEFRRMLKAKYGMPLRRICIQ